MMLSVCCDAPKWREESDICSKCKKHTDFYDTDNLLDEQQHYLGLKYDDDFIPEQDDYDLKDMGDR